MDMWICHWREIYRVVLRRKRNFIPTLTCVLKKNTFLFILFFIRFEMKQFFLDKVIYLFYGNKKMSSAGFSFYLQMIFLLFYF